MYQGEGGLGGNTVEVNPGPLRPLRWSRSCSSSCSWSCWLRTPWPEAPPANNWSVSNPVQPLPPRNPCRVHHSEARTKMATTHHPPSLHIGNRSPEHHQRTAGRPPVLSNRSNNGTLVAELADHNAHRNPECHRRSPITSMTNTQRDTYSAH